MGLLGAAFLQGAGQGLNVLGHGMLKGIEREDEQEMWEKRTKLLAEIQRESAKTIRKDAFDFDNNPENVAAGVATATTRAEAAAKVSRGERVKDATDPGLLAAEADKVKRDRENKVADAKAVTQVATDETLARGGSKEYLAAVKAIAAAGAAPDRTDYKGRALDNAIKQIAVDNAKNLADLKTEFGKPETTPERRKEITEHVSMLTGKDNDKFLPVPLKDADGNVTGYKIFDTKGGRWVEDKPDPGKIMSDARAAIAAGADPAKVNERLKSLGLEPIGDNPTKADKPKSGGMLGPREPEPNKTDKPTFDYLQAPDLRPPTRLQQLEKLEEQNRLTPMQATELKALRGGR